MHAHARFPLEKTSVLLSKATICRVEHFQNLSATPYQNSTKVYISGQPVMDECCWPSAGHEGSLLAINSALSAMDGGLPAVDALDHHAATKYKQSKRRIFPRIVCTIHLSFSWINPNSCELKPPTTNLSNFIACWIVIQGVQAQWMQNKTHNVTTPPRITINT